MPHPTQMSPADTALLVIDVQDKLLPLIPSHAAMVLNIAFLIDAAGFVQIPVTATEQYPKGLGPTTAELAKRIPVPPEKTAFSCCAIESVVEGFHRGAAGPRCFWPASKLTSAYNTPLSTCSIWISASTWPSMPSPVVLRSTTTWRFAGSKKPG